MNKLAAYMIYKNLKFILYNQKHKLIYFFRIYWMMKNKTMLNNITHLF